MQNANRIQSMLHNSEDRRPEQTEPATSWDSGSRSLQDNNKPLVLVIDDDRSFAALLRHYLEDKNLRVETFNTLEEAKAWESSSPPLLIILDINMSGQDGRGFVLAMREEGKFGDCPIVIVTGMEADEELVEFNQQMGFRMTLRKPFPLEALDRFLQPESSRKTQILEKEISQEVFDARKTRILGKMGLDAHGHTTKIAQPLGRKRFEKEMPTKRATNVRTPSSTRMGVSSSSGRDESDALRTQRVAAGRTSTPATTQTTRMFRSTGSIRNQFEPLPPEEARQCWRKGLLRGFAASMTVAFGLAFLPWGYAYKLVILEGAVIGLAVGFGVAQGLKRLRPAPRAISVLLTGLGITLVACLTLFSLRVAFHAPIMERTTTIVEQVADDDPRIVKMPENLAGPSFDMDGVLAGVKIFTHWMVAFSLAFYVAARSLRNIQQQEPSSRTAATSAPDVTSS